MTRSLALLGGLALVLVSSRASADPNTCRTTCAPTGGETLSSDEARVVSASFDGILGELRSCLDTVGAASFNPAVILRFDANGSLLSKRYDLGGYEDLACARNLESQPTAAVIRHETSLRCESRCGAPPAAAPAPAPSGFSAPAPRREIGPRRAPEKKSDKEWYGYQTLIADGASLALMVAGGASGSGKVAGVGVTTYIFAPPIVHWAHGNVGWGFASMGLRLTAPPLLGVIGVIVGGGFGADKTRSSTDAVDIATGAAVGGAIGFLLGYAGVIALDSAVFGYEKRGRHRDPDEDDAAAAKTTTSTFAWQPTVDIKKTGTTIGVAATF